MDHCTNKSGLFLGNHTGVEYYGECEMASSVITSI